MILIPTSWGCNELNKSAQKREYLIHGIIHVHVFRSYFGFLKLILLSRPPPLRKHSLQWIADSVQRIWKNTTFTRETGKLRIFEFLARIQWDRDNSWHTVGVQHLQAWPAHPSYSAFLRLPLGPSTETVLLVWMVLATAWFGSFLRWARSVLTKILEPLISAPHSALRCMIHISRCLPTEDFISDAL